jgi:hypothetical protein
MMVKRGILIGGIELVVISNEFIGEFAVKDLLDVGLVETVLEGALVAEGQAVPALVFDEG